MLHAKGPLLTIDVSERTATTETIDDVLEGFIGGRGVATKLAHDRIPYDADPLGPENRAYITSGPFQQSQMSFTGRMNMTGLSPLTGGLLSSNAGGYVSRNFADTGYSAVEIVGQSDEVLAIHVTDDGVEFEEVPELEEETVSNVTEEMEARHGLEDENLITVGPAGDNEVRFASVMTYDSRAFGRGGLGAILGSKNVKTVSFEGDSRPEIDIDEIQGDVHRDAATSDDPMKRQGTAGGTAFINAEFSLPTRYFSEQHFEGAENIDGDAVEEKKYKKGACSMCAFACKLPTRDEESGLETEGPEFETIYSFGSNAGIDDLVSVMNSNEQCDQFGMDTVSAGVVVSAYLAANDEFGNTELVEELVEKIAYREGDGDTLAEGIDRAHEELGVENWSMKGLEFAAHDGRVLNGQGLSYAVSNRGADHLYGSMLSLEYAGEVDPEGLEGKPQALIELENQNAVRDSAIYCAFGSDYLSDERLETLLDAEKEEFTAVGARVVELERHFNNKRGMTRADDEDMPYELPSFQEALDEYYELRGWNDDGTVSDAQVGGAAASADD